MNLIKRIFTFIITVQLVVAKSPDVSSPIAPHSCETGLTTVQFARLNNHIAASITGINVSCRD